MVDLPLPKNRLKRALAEGRAQIGIWSTLASHVSAEVIAGSGFDWVLIDMEHAPNELPLVLSQLQAMAEGTASAVVRPPWNDTVIFKRLLDIGVQTFVVPFVQSAEEAQRAVAATRYPPDGVRGIATTTRAGRFGRVRNYQAVANAEICVIVQIETAPALANIETIAGVDGIDGLFIGPSDLAAALGHTGDNTHPDVRAVIEDAVARIGATGKCAGILAPVEADARHWLERGCRFVGVGSDVGLLARHSDALAAQFKSP
jgi:4-hydroxy-2-oxoheptanedioate aldolase